MFLDDLEKSSHMLIISLSTFLQATNNILTSTTHKIFNIRQIKSWFLNNHRTIDLSFGRSM